MREPLYDFEADKVAHIYLKVDPFLNDYPQFHDSVEFVFIKQGVVDCYLEQKHQVLVSGDIFFAESYETHHYIAQSEKVEAIVLVLAREYIQVFRKIYPGLTFSTFLTDKDKNKVLFTIMEEWLSIDNKTQIHNYAKATDLFAALVDIYPMINRHEYEGNILQKELLRYIHLHYLEDITVIKMAHDLGYSPEYCSRVLKKTLKNGVRTYINSLRIRKAKELFEDKSLQLTQSEILYQCGFSSPSTYYRVKKQIEKAYR